MRYIFYTDRGRKNHYCWRFGREAGPARDWFREDSANHIVDRERPLSGRFCVGILATPGNIAESPSLEARTSPRFPSLGSLTLMIEAIWEIHLPLLTLSAIFSVARVFDHCFEFYLTNSKENLYMRISFRVPIRYTSSSPITAPLTVFPNFLLLSLYLSSSHRKGPSQAS